MTILAGVKSKLPNTCGVCGRAASGLGYSKKGAPQILWTCGDEQCNRTSGGAYSMSTKELDRYETTAIEKAGADVSVDFLETFMGALWDKGVRDLGAVDGDIFKQIAADLPKSPEYRRAMAKFLTGYSESIKAQFVDGVAPF